MKGFILTSALEKLRMRGFKEDLAILLALLQPGKKDVILDVGAGTGWIASVVATFSEEVFVTFQIRKTPLKNSGESSEKMD